MERLQASDLIYLAPELTLVISAIVISLIDLLLPRRINRDLIGWLSLLGIAGSAAFVVFHAMPLVNGSDSQTISLLYDSYRVDDFANILKLILLGGGVLITLMSIGAVKDSDIQHRGEYYYLLLPALIGGMIMASSAELITLYVGLEVLSITSYILVALRKNHTGATEGAFKYLVTGSIASAFILYGMSFLYGITSTTQIQYMRHMLDVDSSIFPLLYISYILMIGGFAFKIAAAPFHTWAADVYQGAATPVTTFLAAVSKAAGFAILFRVVYVTFFGLGSNTIVPVHHDLFSVLMVLAAAAMILGNTMALKEKNIKRLMAYSGVANAGYLLVPILNHPLPILNDPYFLYHTTKHESMFSEFIYYLIAYVLMNIGMFAAIMMVTGKSRNEELSAFAGLYYRAPATAAAIILIVLSLAGIPITGGFFGKFFILFGTIQSQIYWLAAVMIITSVISYYYYFAIVRQMFMRSSFHAAELTRTIPLTAVLWICALAGVLMGFFPQWLVGAIESIFHYGYDLFG
ncbi:NADH-quinone oxidoreductase subunit N [Insulibacter thermoxylanivorax]|uniref:NADH-quinone oxidoreductase subunit N n=1 Tax=Insulibacter thermoxylanivorax TaxID=2749268 RepID=A0A916QEP8_9BACL|nr:NADH-quinone oxidoreductase subunit N [Insulibacter thermoxylanivorax]GFR39400.1 NADH-quinone oxidoreductase subunit N [Insulibacter thermoxylanivorax]